MDVDKTSLGDVFAKAKAGYRVCSECMQEKHVSMFYSDGTNRDGSQRYRRDCKVCYKTKRTQAKEMKAKAGAKRWKK